MLERVLEIIRSRDEFAITSHVRPVNFPLTINGVDVAVFFRELDNGSFRVSLRSKNSIDVSEIAGAFGGGGHRNASGCTLAGPLESAKNLVLARIESRINGE